MAKGQSLSKYQKGIVRRYYENKDTLSRQKLAEIVSELYLAEGKKKETLWKRAEKALSQAKANEAQVAQILKKKDLEALAKLVNEIF